jgi:hypothetical protein
LLGGTLPERINEPVDCFEWSHRELTRPTNVLSHSLITPDADLVAPNAELRTKVGIFAGAW